VAVKRFMAQGPEFRIRTTFLPNSYDHSKCCGLIISFYFLSCVFTDLILFVTFSLDF
jgi:hypothetical protein